MESPSRLVDDGTEYFCFSHGNHVKFLFELEITPPHTIMISLKSFSNVILQTCRYETIKHLLRVSL
jgi:hypothetical protein